MAGRSRARRVRARSPRLEIDSASADALGYGGQRSMGNLARGHKSVEQVAEEQPDEQPDEQLGHWPPPPVVRALRQYSSYSTTPSRMPIACSLTNFMRSLPEA